MIVCQIVTNESRRHGDITVRVTEAERDRAGSIAQAALIKADLLGDRKVAYVRCNGQTYTV
tara:strand:+ start:1977 stop:2159 length:183 start_codon:yes stop_codon:yes gene_type:complete